MVLHLKVNVSSKHSTDGHGLYLSAEFSTVIPKEDADSSNNDTPSHHEKGRETSKTKEESWKTAEGFLMIHERPTPYPNGYWPGINIRRDSKGVFYVMTNGPTSGGPWRRMIDRLLCWALYEPGAAHHRYEQPPEWLDLAELRRCLEKDSDDGYTVFRQTRYSAMISQCISSAILPYDANNHDAPPEETMHITIHAPAIYSYLDFNGLSYILGQSFRTQIQREPTISNLNAAIFFEALTFDAHYENIMVPDDLVFHELQRLPIQRYTLTRQKEDMKLSMRLAWSALQRVEDGTIVYLTIFLDLAYYLLMALKIMRIYPELDEILNGVQKSLFSQTKVDPRMLSNFASVLSAYYEAGGDVERLHTGISLIRPVATNEQISDADRSDAVHNIGTMLRTRYSVFHDIKDLEEAIRMHQVELELVQRGVGDEIDIRWNFIRLAELSGVQEPEKVQMYREVYSLCPQNHRIRPSICSSLSGYILKRFIRYEPINDSYLEEAIEYAKEGISLLPPDEDAFLPHLLCDLAACYVQAATKYAERSDKLGESLVLIQRALKLYGDSPSRFIALGELGKCYRTRFVIVGKPEDATSAYEYLTQALEAFNQQSSPQGSGRIRVVYLSVLAELNLHEGPIFDPISGFRYLNTMLDIHECNPRTRLYALYDALRNFTLDRDAFADTQQEQISTELALKDLISIVFIKAVHMLPQVAYLGLNVKSRLQAFMFFGELTANVTVFLTRSKHRVQAIEIIEEGRAGFWTQSMQLRAAFEKLPVDYREPLRSLADRLEQQSYASMHSTTESHVRVEQDIRTQRESQEFQRLVHDVRKLPGFDKFLFPKSYEDLHEAAKYGPVIILVSDANSCFAHIMKPLVAGQPVSHGMEIKLHITREELRRLGASLKLSNDKSRSAIKGGRDLYIEDDRPEVKGDESDLEEFLEDFSAIKLGEAAKEDTDSSRLGKRAGSGSITNVILATIWEKVVKRILDALGMRQQQRDKKEGNKLPRVWWCPTGEFTFLPLHAAGSSGPHGAEWCMDYVVSSYTPTLTTLINTRELAKPISRADAKILLAAVPVPYKGDRLRGTVTEVNQIREKLRGNPDVFLPLPSEEDATVNPEHGVTLSTVLEQLPRATILHLACHGKQDHNDPLESGFILKDDILPIIKLMPTSLPNAFLAFLSACETAKGDATQPDQVVHLAATMLFAGFKSVIGTMWLMNDADGARVSQLVYERLFSGGGSEYLDPNVVPYALHEAVQRMRKEGLGPNRWAAFIHLGM